MDRLFNNVCDWCGQESANIQISGDTALCPSCCPGVDTGRVVVLDLMTECDLPTVWHHMTQEEEYQYAEQDMSVEEVMDKYGWDVSPKHFAVDVGREADGNA